LREVIAAAEMLANDWGVSSEIFSATSFSELAKEARETERWNRLHPEATERVPHVAHLFAGSTPIIAATDYVAALPQMIAPYIDARLVALGTDGFGRSDTRSALRRFFEVDRHQIVVAALHELARRGEVPRAAVTDAIKQYGIDADASAPWTV
jgi:pyruvate dehydrogenase E1 component